MTGDSLTTLFNVPSPICAGCRTVERAENKELTSPNYHLDHLSYLFQNPAPHQRKKNRNQASNPRGSSPTISWDCWTLSNPWNFRGFAASRLLHLRLDGLGAFVQLRQLGLELVLVNHGHFHGFFMDVSWRLYLFGGAYQC